MKSADLIDRCISGSLNKWKSSLASRPSVELYICNSFSYGESKLRAIYLARHRLFIAARFSLRHALHDDHLCTCEVAALCLELAGETRAAQTLEAYLDVFTHHYLQAKNQLPVDENDLLHQRLRDVSAQA